MNTLTIAVLLVCATMAYASAIPDDSKLLPAMPAEEILQGEESRYQGGGRGNYGRGGGGHGNYGHGGGGHGNYGHGGGGHGNYGHGGGGHGNYGHGGGHGQHGGGGYGKK